VLGLLGEVLYQKDSRFRPLTESSIKEVEYGGYSKTCCGDKKLASKQRKKQDAYANKYLLKSTWEEALLDVSPRPLLQVFWTLTYSPVSSLKDDYGNTIASLRAAAGQANINLPRVFECSIGLPMFANIIMADWVDHTILHVATLSSLSGPSMTKGPECFKDPTVSQGDNSRSIWTYVLVTLGVLLLAVLVAATYFLLAAKSKPVRRQSMQRRSVAARPSLYAYPAAGGSAHPQSRASLAQPLRQTSGIPSRQQSRMSCAPEMEMGVTPSTQRRTVAFVPDMGPATSVRRQTSRMSCVGDMGLSGSEPRQASRVSIAPATGLAMGEIDFGQRQSIHQSRQSVVATSHAGHQSRVSVAVPFTLPPDMTATPYRSSPGGGASHPDQHLYPSNWG